MKICSRCSGYASGLFGLAALRSHLGQLFQTLTIQVQLTICILLAIPLIVDWLTQSWGLRNSNNVVRFTTGIILGADVLLYSAIGLPQPLKTFIFAFSVLITLLIGLEGLSLRRQEV